MKAKRRRVISVILTVLILTGVTVSVNTAADGAVYRQGSTGSGVTALQEKLAQLGYYGGSIDGIYGTKTKNAVLGYQRDMGLTADGIAGTQTLSSLGLSSGGAQDNDVYLLARLISAEARGEPYVGQVAVGAVVLNRVRHPSFPNSISGVIYQPGAFSCMNDGQWNASISDTCYQAARDALNGWDPSGGAIYYFNPSTATSKWIWSRPLIVEIGKHRFCS